MNQLSSEGELKKRILKESVILDISRDSHGRFHFDEEQLEKAFIEMEPDSTAKYPISFDLSSIRFIDEAKKDFPKYELADHPVYTYYEYNDADVRKWFLKWFGE